MKYVIDIILCDIVSHMYNMIYINISHKKYFRFSNMFGKINNSLNIYKHFFYVFVERNVNIGYKGYLIIF